MGDLEVRVWYRRQLVETRLLDVRHSISLGESPGAAVAFPGLELEVSREAAAVRVGDHWLPEGETHVLEVGEVRVQLCHVTPMVRGPLSRARSSWDVRFFAVLVCVSVMSTWLDQADHWLGTHDLADQGSVTDALSEQSRALASPMMGKGGEVTTSLEAPAIEGPAHVPDDQSTGVGYHAWLVRGLSPDSREAEATRRLALDPEDGESRRVLARTRYDQEHFAESARHYRQLLLRYPGDRPARLRLAWAFKRQGRHLEELAQYRALVREDARDVFALGGGGVALVRLGRLDDAQVLFERLEVVAPDSAHTAWTSALFAASEGKNDEALEFVDHFFEKRGELPSEIKLEFCRDLALDPLLAPLRRDPRLRFLLLRHLGPASPRAL